MHPLPYPMVAGYSLEVAGFNLSTVAQFRTVNQQKNIWQACLLYTGDRHNRLLSHLTLCTPFKLASAVTKHVNDNTQGSHLTGQLGHTPQSCTFREVNSGNML